MLESVGQALRQARLHKNLSIEEVSHATKIRAARITDLENDDYIGFPNITYARSFLVLYAKFLGVDITKYPTVEAGSTVGLADYEYLQSNETPAPQPTRQETKGPPEKPRWLIPFFVFLVMLAIGALIGWGLMNLKRLGPVEKMLKQEAATATPTPLAQSIATPGPPVREAAILPPSPPPAAPPASSPEEVAIPAPPPLQLAPEPEVRRAEPLPAENSDDALLAAATAAATATPAPAAPATAAAFPPPGALREIKVRATKRIKVRIVRDNPGDSSLYYGFVNPAQPVLTYRGKYFWIKTPEPEALQVTVNGQPATGLESGVEIILSPGV